jgi:hypothetical protein
LRGGSAGGAAVVVAERQPAEQMNVQRSGSFNGGRVDAETGG